MANYHSWIDRNAYWIPHHLRTINTKSLFLIAVHFHIWWWQTHMLSEFTGLNQSKFPRKKHFENLPFYWSLVYGSICLHSVLLCSFYSLNGNKSELDCFACSFLGLTSNKKQNLKLPPHHIAWWFCIYCSWRQIQKDRITNILESL